MVKFLKDLGVIDVLLSGIVLIMILISSAMYYNKYLKISKANIEIETSDKIYSTLKETLMISPDNGCIDFYDLLKEYNIKHCGQYTVRYLKDTK